MHRCVECGKSSIFALCAECFVEGHEESVQRFKKDGTTNDSLMDRRLHLIQEDDPVLFVGLLN